MIDLTNENYDDLNEKYSNILEYLPHDKNVFLHIVNTGINYIREKHNNISINQKASIIILLRKWFNDFELIDDNNIFNLIDDYINFNEKNNISEDLESVQEYMKIKNPL